MSNGALITIIALSASALLMLLVHSTRFISSWHTPNMATKILNFLDRPYGGIEVETIYGLSELWFAVIFTISSQAVLNMTTTEKLYGFIPHYIIAIPWWLSSIATLSGLILFYYGNRWCAPLRWLGAFVSSWIWSAMLARGAVESGGALGTLAFYFFGAVWQIRIMMSAWRRWRGSWHWYANS